MSLNINEIDEKYNVRPFVDPPETKLAKELDLITLNALDLSTYKEGEEGLESRKKLAKELESSITTYGFFNIINFGYETEKIEKLRSIAQSLLELPYNEQKDFLAGASRKELEIIKSPSSEVKNDNSLQGERGQGFKPKGYWKLKEGVRDSITHYNFRNMLHDDIFFDKSQKNPKLVEAHLKEIQEYYNFIHNDILKRLSNLCDLILNIPEGTIWNSYFKVRRNDNLNSGGGHGRFMLYEPPEESNNPGDTWLRGHSDISAFAFITSQPMLSLQIKDFYDGKWKYVNHRPNSLIVNIGDAMEFISGGYFKAVVHRVVNPPLDQRGRKRLVLIYFCNPSYTSLLDPDNLQSSKLKSLGYTKENKLRDWEQITFSQWDSVKGDLLGRSEVGERNRLNIYGRYVERWHFFEGNKLQSETA